MVIVNGQKEQRVCLFDLPHFEGVVDNHYLYWHDGNGNVLSVWLKQKGPLRIFVSGEKTQEIYGEYVGPINSLVSQ